MTINHLIVGTQNPEESAKFYCDFLGFHKTEEDAGHPDGLVLHHDDCDLLLIPYALSRLPSPVHFAFEVGSVSKFEALFKKSLSMNLQPKSASMTGSPEGCGQFVRGNLTYKHFYVLDPSRVILEVMVKT